MAVRTLVWRGLDAPRMEILRVESLDRAHAGLWPPIKSNRPKGIELRAFDDEVAVDH